MLVKAAWTGLVCVVLIALVTPEALADQDPSDYRGRIGELVTGKGETAEIQADTEGSAGVGGAYGQATGSGAGPAGSEPGSNSWAKYELVIKPGSETPQLCLTVNAGLPSTTGGRTRVCYDATTPEPAAAPVTADPSTAAAQAIARLTVPTPPITISPHPSDNQWGVSAVGLPLWVWTEDPGPVTTTVSEQGIDITMQANRGTVRFDWGDGTTSLCNTMTPRPPKMDPLKPSPDCGHSYLEAGDYTITATAGWAVSWQALGLVGVLPLSSSTTVDIPVREFQTVVVG